MSDITQRLKAQRHEQSQLINQISKLEYELAIRKSRNKKLFKIVNRYYTLQQVRLMMEADDKLERRHGLGSGREGREGRLAFGEGNMMNVADRHLQFEDYERRQYQQRQRRQQVAATPVVVSPGNSSMGSPRGENNVSIGDSSSSSPTSCKRQRYR